MTISEIYDSLKTYIDTKLHNLSLAYEQLFIDYKTKEVGSSIDNVNIVGTNIGDVNTVVSNIDDVITDANNISDINTVADAINGGGSVGASGGQFLGGGLIKGVQYMSKTSKPNENIVVASTVNAFAIDSFTLADGALITVEDGAVYKIL